MRQRDLQPWSRTICAAACIRAAATAICAAATAICAAATAICAAGLLTRRAQRPAARTLPHPCAVGPETHRAKILPTHRAKILPTHRAKILPLTEFTHRAKFARNAAVIVAVGLALAAIATTARGEATRFGDIAVTPLPIPSCESVHGYTEYRFAVENRSATQPHQITINLPYESYRDDTSLSGLSRSVVVAPGATVTVSLPQCALSLQGANAAISIDGRRERGAVRVNLENHGGRYMSKPRDTVRVILASRGVSFPAPGEKDPVILARAEQDVREWSTEWLAYSRYDGIVVASDEMERMPPPVRLALIRYVECGGTLYVWGSWQPPEDLPTASVSGPSRVYTIGFGACLVGSSPRAGDAAHTQFLSMAGDTAKPFRVIRSVGDANRDFPVVEDVRVPVRGMLVLMLAFVIVIGPVNLILLGRLNKRIWLLATVPLLALLTGTLMFGYSIFSEGVEGHYRTTTLTLLDETTGRATSLGWAAYYSPLAAREGLHFSYQTELTPQIVEDYYGGPFGGSSSAPSGGRTVDWTQDQHLASGWVAARVPVHFVVRKSEVRRERLAVRTGAGGCISVVNGLGVPIKKLTLADRDGRLHAAENIPAGAEVALLPREGQAGGSNMRDLYGFGWIPSIRSMVDSPQQYLRPMTYVAVLDASPFTDNAMPAAREHSGLAVVYGRMGSRTDGN